MSLLENIMTIRFPNPNIFDRFLKLLGKKRGVISPVVNYEKFGHSSYVKAYKESFWRAFFRSRAEALPDSYIDIFEIEDFRKEIMLSEKKKENRHINSYEVDNLRSGNIV